MKFGRKRRKGMEEFAKPQMTSLVDVLTVLVFFLLKNFSTEGDIVTQTKNLELPESSSKAKPEQMLNISISARHILAEGTPVALVSEEQERGGNDIPGLARFLEDKRKQTEEIAEFDKNVSFSGKLTIQGDRTIPYWLLQKVLATCGDNGYSSFSLAVMKKDVD
ncbi:MAG TPA: biopolymer transporter ExbD [Fibrobacteria bacterium]|nr:biopolymer transporter ExbD [Fibrobacteria bacterium]